MNAVVEVPEISSSIILEDIPEDILPKPVGWRMLIEPIRVEERTKGGLYLPDQAKQAKEYLRYIGYVRAQGELCYRHHKFADPATGLLGAPWCAVGQWIVFNQHEGQEVQVRGPNGKPIKLRLINDDAVLAVAPNPEALLIYV